MVSLLVDAAPHQWGPIPAWTPQVAFDVSEIIKKLSEIDKKLGAKDCFDPKKQAFLKELDERISCIENDTAAFGTHIREAIAVVKDLIKKNES